MPGIIHEKLEVPYWLDILKRLPNARGDWRAKRPLEKFCYLYGIGRMAWDPIALPVFQEDQTLRFFSFFAFTYTLLTTLLMFYTLIWYGSHGELEKALPCTCLIVGVSSSVYPFFNAILTKNRFLLHSLVVFGARYIYRDDHPDKEYQRICTEHMNLTMKHFLTKMTMVTLGYLVAVIGPTYAFLIQGIRTTTINVAVPFTEEDSWIAFLVNEVLQTLPATHGALFLLGGEIVIEMFANTVTISPHLINHRLRTITSDYSEGRINKAQVQYAFTDFVRQCNDANGYVRNLADLLAWRSMLTPVGYFYSIGMPIYCQYKIGFVAGYGIAFMLWTQFYYICDLGESVSDNGFDECLIDSDWYVLPRELQGYIECLINRQQNVAGLSIGPFGADLNRFTFKTITNRIYSFVMFLVNYEEQ